MPCPSYPPWLGTSNSRYIYFIFVFKNNTTTKYQPHSKILNEQSLWWWGRPRSSLTADRTGPPPQNMAGPPEIRTSQRMQQLSACKLNGMARHYSSQETANTLLLIWYETETMWTFTQGSHGRHMRFVLDEVALNSWVSSALPC
jgi:hypothetical protein